ncbi:protein ENHANCED DISEASE RESISTANCE 2-like [Arachis stenosperma]|uniref:protein ENHANCED DISEASE RESISTANCE 2-like n=1 Tax=Arachis stenosperma TaxID=217475 RepID=UPI0025AD5ED2|nr:protein ENHANCED DISEASE RESISTANCE 2-like [Arachis stenosperma]
MEALNASSGSGRFDHHEEKGIFEYFGWVYHLGVHSMGSDYHHLRFLFVKGKCVAMYKRDPHENPGIKPIRLGVVGPTLMVENLGQRRIANMDLYVIRISNRLDDSKKGDIACATATEAQRWMEAFNHAKQQAENDLSSGGDPREKLNQEELDLDHRNRHSVKRFGSGLRKLIRIGQGPEILSRQSSRTRTRSFSFDGFDKDQDVFEEHQWKCVRTMSGVRIFEDLTNYKINKSVLAKSVAVIDTSAETVLEVFLSIEREKRYEWDMLMCDIELVESFDGHYDVLYGTYDPKYLTRWNSKRDFIFSRQWFRGQDGNYTILQLPATHKKKPPRSGYRRTKINPSTWEIRNLNTPMGVDRQKCLVTHTLEIHSVSWFHWKNNNQNSKFERSIPYALLCQVAGLKEYIGANPSIQQKNATSARHANIAKSPVSSAKYEDDEVQDEFYDAITAYSSDEETYDHQERKAKPNNASPHTASNKISVPAAEIMRELDTSLDPIPLDVSGVHGSLRKGNDEKDTDCWTCPSCEGFKIRGKNYLKDNTKVIGGDPLLKLIAVDWLKVDKAMDRVALHPKCLVQLEEGKKLPFILVFNLQVPAKPNYSLVLYYASDRPIKEDSLLAKFVDGSDAFRDSRFKLIPSIVEGYWMVKRAVGTKACLLGKAVTCKYHRQDNFLEIDLDIGSSSVARRVIGLVMGYVTSLVVDLAILIEAKEEDELPEYILGAVRLNRLSIDSAVSWES